MNIASKPICIYTLGKTAVFPRGYASFYSKFTSQRKIKLSISFKHQDSTKKLLGILRCLTLITEAGYTLTFTPLTHSYRERSGGACT